MHGSISSDQSSINKNGNQVPLVGSIGDLFRDYGERYISAYHPGSQKLKLIRSIRVCKTPFLGGHGLVRDGCGDIKYVYHSCGNSQCPCCQSIKRLQWQDKVSARMLSVPYVHTTFTLPHQLNGMAKRNPRQIYGLLIRSAWQTIKQLCKDPSNLGGLPGMISVLHTFGSDMKYHVHVHTLITFGGLTENGEWVWPKRKKKLASFRAMCSTFRNIFLTGLWKLIRSGEVSSIVEYTKLEAELRQVRWVVHNTYPTTNTGLIENYLARYINRVAISSNRLRYIEDQKEVQIIYNNYKAQKSNEAAPKSIRPLSPLTAMDMILQHVLPRYFQKARYYGLHSAITFKRIKGNVPSTLLRNGQTIRTLFQILNELLKLKPYVCELCGSEDYIKLDLAPDTGWLQRCRIIRLKNRAPPNGRSKVI